MRLHPTWADEAPLNRSQRRIRSLLEMLMARSGGSTHSVRMDTLSHSLAIAAASGRPYRVSVYPGQGAFVEYIGPNAAEPGITVLETVRAEGEAADTGEARITDVIARARETAAHLGVEHTEDALRLSLEMLNGLISPNTAKRRLAELDEARKPPPGTCNICSQPLNAPDKPESQDCGGDCLRCMAVVAHDPDCLIAMGLLDDEEAMRIITTQEAPMVHRKAEEGDKDAMALRAAMRGAGTWLETWEQE